MYEDLKGWQTGIAALLGFLALLAGALWNFHLNRRRDALLRKEEAVSIAAALYGEMILLRDEIARLARAVAYIEANEQNRTTRKIDAHFLESNKLSEPILYGALASKIGLLSGELILAITEFHKNFQEAKRSLPLLVENKERGYSFSPLYVLRPARAAVKNIVPALRTIEGLVGVPTAAHDPDLGLTEEIIEQEEEIFR